MAKFYPIYVIPKKAYNNFFNLKIDNKFYWNNKCFTKLKNNEKFLVVKGDTIFFCSYKNEFDVQEIHNGVTFVKSGIIVIGEFEKFIEAEIIEEVPFSGEYNKFNANGTTLIKGTEEQYDQIIPYIPDNSKLYVEITGVGETPSIPYEGGKLYYADNKYTYVQNDFGFVYFVPTEPGKVKIGKEKTWDSRIKARNVYFEEDVKAVLKISGSELENYYHRKFKQERITMDKELFRLTDNLQSFINLERERQQTIIQNYLEVKKMEVNLH